MDFASNSNFGPFDYCMAVSKGADPVHGGYWLYAIPASDNAHPWARRTCEEILDQIPDRVARQYLKIGAHSDMATEPHLTNGLIGLRNVLKSVTGYGAQYTIEGGMEMFGRRRPRVADDGSISTRNWCACRGRTELFVASFAGTDVWCSGISMRSSSRSRTPALKSNGPVTPASRRDETRRFTTAQVTPCAIHPVRSTASAATDDGSWVMLDVRWLLRLRRKSEPRVPDGYGVLGYTRAPRRCRRLSLLAARIGEPRDRVVAG
jgi:hypothetical protein